MRVNFAVEVIHHERAEYRNILLTRHPIEQILEIHAGSDIPSFPKDIDHLSPPPHLGVAPRCAGSPDDLSGKAEEHWGIRQRLAHEARQSFVRIDDSQLSASLRGPHVHSFGLQARAEGIPVLGRRHKNQSFAVR